MRGCFPHAGDECFVPAWLWPEEQAQDTPYGTGWVGQVTVAKAGLVEVQCTHDEPPAQFSLRGFRCSCSLLLESSDRLCTLDSDPRRVVFTHCRLGDLLALCATSRRLSTLVGEHLASRAVPRACLASPAAHALR